MAFSCGFFNSKNRDRIYTAENFTEYLSCLICDGVLDTYGDCFALTADGGMSVTVGTGKAWIKGHYFSSDEPYTLSLSSYVGSALSQYIMVGICCDMETRDCTIAVKDELAASDGGPPYFTNTDTKTYLTLAAVHLPAGANSVTEDNIIDFRDDEEKCGYVKCILGKCDIAEILEQLADLIAKLADQEKRVTILEEKSGSGSDDKMDKVNPTGSGAFSLNRAEGTKVGTRSFAEGTRPTASGEASHAEGNCSVASGNASHAEGSNTKAQGGYAHAEGSGTTAIGGYSHTEGYGTVGRKPSSHAEGNSTEAAGDASHAEGIRTTASGSSAHAEGSDTSAEGYYSHAEGTETSASGDAAHAEGGGTTASNESAHAEGNSTTASGRASHAEGMQTVAKGIGSHAGGDHTIAEGSYTTAIGRRNKNTTALFVVGNGVLNSSSDRSDAFIVEEDGSVTINETKIVIDDGGIHFSRDDGKTALISW